MAHGVEDREDQLARIDLERLECVERTGLRGRRGTRRHEISRAFAGTNQPAFFQQVVGAKHGGLADAVLRSQMPDRRQSGAHRQSPGKRFRWPGCRRVFRSGSLADADWRRLYEHAGQRPAGWSKGGVGIREAPPEHADGPTQANKSPQSAAITGFSIRKKNGRLRSRMLARKRISVTSWVLKRLHAKAAIPCGKAHFLTYPIQGYYPLSVCADTAELESYDCVIRNVAPLLQSQVWRQHHDAGDVGACSEDLSETEICSRAAHAVGV